MKTPHPISLGIRQHTDAENIAAQAETERIWKEIREAKRSLDWIGAMRKDEFGQYRPTHTVCEPDLRII